VAVNNHLSTFYNLPVRDFSVDEPIEDLAACAPALRVEYEGGADAFQELLDALVAHPEIDQLRALVIGTWDEEQFDTDNNNVTTQLLAVRDKLPSLRALFFGDIMYEECEISWIIQGDNSPLLHGLPALEVFGVRGGGTEFRELRHANLRSLTVETGGLSAACVQQIGAAYLPALEHLELWLGTDNYGGDASVEDLAPILSGRAFPKLRSLGLKNSQRQGEVVTALLGSPVLDEIEALDLSMGTLTDAEIEGLRTMSARKLKTLNVSDNYLSEAAVASLRGRHFEVISHGQRQVDARYPDSRYCSVNE
jgi:hypothetical protein